MSMSVRSSRSALDSNCFNLAFNLFQVVFCGVTREHGDTFCWTELPEWPTVEKHTRIL